MGSFPEAYIDLRVTPEEEVQLFNTLLLGMQICKSNLTGLS